MSQLSEQVSDEWTEWEVVDVNPSVKPIRVNNPINSQISASSNGSLININTHQMRSQFLQNKDEEKDSELSKQYRIQHSKYENELKKFAEQQELYLNTYGKKYTNFDNNNANSHSNELNKQTQEKIDKLTQQQKEHQSQLDKAYSECQSLRQQCEQMKNQVEQTRQMQQFTNKMIETQQRQHQIQLEQQRQLLMNANRFNNNNNNNSNNTNTNPNTNSNSNPNPNPNNSNTKSNPTIAPLQNLSNSYNSNDFSNLNLTEIETWKCDKCNSVNDEAYRFCPKCGTNNDLFDLSITNTNLNLNSKLNQNNSNNFTFFNYNSSDLEKLMTQGILGEGKLLPNEEKEIGWILKNESNIEMNLKGVKLERVGGDKSVIIKEEGKLYDYNVKSGEELYILVNIVAPSLPGKYSTFWQLVMNNNQRIGNVLELKTFVKKQFSNDKEQKIKKVLQIFPESNRKTVIYALTKCKWDQTQATNQLLDGSIN